MEAEFEARLKRSRGSFNKAQYLRIQASYLLDNSEEYVQLKGIELMERLITDYPTEEFSIIFGQEQLGDHYLKFGDFEKAEMYFRIVTNRYYEKCTRSGTSAIADLKLVEIILTTKQKGKFDEAYQICNDFPVSELIFNDNKFYYARLTAEIYDKKNHKVKAKEYAKTAINISVVC